MKIYLAIAVLIAVILIYYRRERFIYPTTPTCVCDRVKQCECRTRKMQLISPTARRRIMSRSPGIIDMYYWRGIPFFVVGDIVYTNSGMPVDIPIRRIGYRMLENV